MASHMKEGFNGDAAFTKSSSLTARPASAEHRPLGSVKRLVCIQRTRIEYINKAAHSRSS